MVIPSPPAVTATTIKVAPGLRYEWQYLLTVGGILKMLQGALGLAGFLCVTASGAGRQPRGVWYLTVCLVSFWTSLVMLVLYAFHVVEKLHSVPWLRMELVFSCCWTVLYLVAAVLCTASGGGDVTQPWLAAGVVAFMGMSSHAWEVALKFRHVRNGNIAQGHRTVATSNDFYAKY